MHKYRKSTLRAIHKAYTPEESAALDKLKSFLDENEPELARFLQNTWNAQGRAITYKELREAILNGEIDSQIIDDWMQDYNRFVQIHLAPMWRAAMVTANELLTSDRPSFIFDPMQAGVISWTDNRAAEFVTSVTRDQVKGLREVIKRAAQTGMSVDELSHVIRPMVGLNWQQSRANMRYYETKVTNGMSHTKALDKAIRYSARQSRYRGYMIARTELAFSYNQGSLFGIEQAQAQGLIGDVVKIWCTADDERDCDLCNELERQSRAAVETMGGIGLRDDFDFRTKLTDIGIKRTPPAHPHCLMPGTKVSAGDIIGGSVRRFEGTVITIRTSSGNELSVTPNHPILTDRGFVAAGDLKEGDNVVETVSIDGFMDTIKADNYNIPTAIEEITDSLMMSGSVSAHSVPVSAKDFHGDGIDGDIAVIYTDRLLPDNRETETGEGFGKMKFSEGSVGIVNMSLIVDGSCNLGLQRDNSSTDGIMGSGCDGGTFFGGQLGHSDNIRFASASDFQTFISENPCNSSSRDTESLRHGKDGIPRMISGYDIIPDGGMFKAVPIFSVDVSEIPENTVGIEPSIDSAIRDAELVRNILDSKTGAIHFSSIVKIDRGFSNTHVYNLQTKSGVYVANNIVTHNCLCTIIYEEITPPIIPKDQQ